MRLCLPGWVCGFVLTALLSGFSLEAGVPCSTDILGDMGQDPFVSDISAGLPPGCILDFGDREVVLGGSLQGVDLTILAGRLELTANGRIDGGPGTTRIIVTASPLHDGSAVLAGTFSNLGPHGGGLMIGADGPVSLEMTCKIDMSAEDPLGSGGFLLIEGGSDIVLRPGAAVSGVAGVEGDFGAEVSLYAGRSVILDGTILVTGGIDSPGAVTVQAGAELLVRGPIHASGHCAAGTCSRGGVARLTSVGPLEIRANIDAEGPDGALSVNEGRGGEVSLDSQAGILIQAGLYLSGGSLARGGVFQARCDGDYIQTGIIDVRGRAAGTNGGLIRIASRASVYLESTRSPFALAAGGGDEADGGAISIVGEGDVTVAGDIAGSANYPTGGIEIVSRTGAVEVRSRVDSSGMGQFGTGGVIGIYSVTGISLAGATLDVSGNGADGLGGVVRLDSFQAVGASEGTRLLASGDKVEPSPGEGGSIDVAGCQVDLEQGGSLAANGIQGGAVFLTAAYTMAISASVAATEGGLIQVRHLPALPPDLEGSTFSPEPEIIPGPVQDTCFGLPACDSVTDLNCLADGTTVGLSWRSPAVHTEVIIIRDGVEVGAQASSVETFTDPGVEPGTHTYLVRGLCNGRESAAVSCSLEVTSSLQQFSRGNCDTFGVTDIADPILLLQFLFSGTVERLRCEKACDANDDGVNAIDDAILVLTVLFVDATAHLPPPFLTCGVEGMDVLTCEAFDACPGF